MKLLRNGPESLATIEDLDELWSAAEALGRVEVDHEFGSRGIYKVEIRGTTRGGSTLWATGRDQSIHGALRAAISEALLHTT